MTIKATLCAYLPDEEQQLLVSSFISAWGDYSISMDSGSMYPYVVQIDVEWDFTNDLLYQLLDYATESDLTIEVEIYSSGDEFNIYALCGGEEEQGAVFEYVLNDHSFLHQLNSVDRLLLLLNAECASLVTDAMVTDVLNGGSIAQLQKFMTAGLSYGSEHIVAQLPVVLQLKLQGLPNIGQASDASNAKLHH